MSLRRLHPWTRANVFLGLLLGALLTLDLWPSALDGQAPLTHLRPGDVDNIRVEHGKRLHLSLHRGDTGWRLQHPEAADARAERVAQLLSVLGAPRHYSFAADGELARYGLGEAALTLRLEGASFGELSLHFGDREPGQQGRYVLVGEDISVVDDLFFNLLSLPARHFIGD